MATKGQTIIYKTHKSCVNAAVSTDQGKAGRYLATEATVECVGQAFLVNSSVKLLVQGSAKMVPTIAAGAVKSWWPFLRVATKQVELPS
jgi:hypothetical protein